MSEQDPRPPVWIGHVVLETDRLAETVEFMCKLGMRPIIQRAEVAVLELRGGTHLVLIAKRPERYAERCTSDHTSTQKAHTKSQNAQTVLM